MEGVTKSDLYARAPKLLWRDIGTRIVVLPAAGNHDVLVLGGGGAAAWRMLDVPLTVAELTSRFETPGGPRPSESEIQSCLHELVDLQLVVDHSPPS